jgi:hypothetical protein
VAKKRLYFQVELKIPKTFGDLLFNKIPGFAWRGEAAPSETWDFIGILFYLDF